MFPLWAKQFFYHFQHILDQFDMIFSIRNGKIIPNYYFLFLFKNLVNFFSNFFFEIEFLFQIFHKDYQVCFGLKI